MSLDFMETLFGFIVLTSILMVIETVDVRLTDGLSENQGKVEVRKDNTQFWGQVCNLHFGQLEANAVCRQLHYKYARNDRDVFQAKLPDFVLENIHCYGNESNLGECIHGDWKVNTGECNSEHNYAGVCCSNSPDFGEIRDNVFVSDCADNWLDAEEICTTKNGILADNDTYTSLLGPTDVSQRKKAFWTRMFFTPFIWNNGCFKISDTSMQPMEFILKNNSAQACLQFCSIDSHSAFLLNADRCQCLTSTMKSSIVEVYPSMCYKTCDGNVNTYCGGDNVWNHYSIAPEALFFRTSDPQKNDERQCAFIANNRKLESERCSDRRGYICAHVENNGTIKLLYFKDNAFYYVNHAMAQYKCKDSDRSMHLVGESIIINDNTFFDNYDNLWVDVKRTLTSVYKIKEDIGNKKVIDGLRDLNPKWCQSHRLHGENFIDELSLCQTERLRYICSLDGNGYGTTINTGSTENVTGSTIFISSLTTVTPIYDDTDLNKSGLQWNFRDMITVAVSVSCVVILLILVAMVIYCWCKRSRKKAYGTEPPRESCEVCPNEYQMAMPVVESQEHIYNELDDPSRNIYHEADSLINNDTQVKEYITDEELFKKPLPPEPIESENDERNTADDTRDIAPDNDTSDVVKDPVTMKRSYSTPKDLVNVVDGNNDVLNEFNDPSYTYPFDKIQRSENIDVEVSEDLNPPSVDVQNDTKVSCANVPDKQNEISTDSKQTVV
ncbi:Scavenger receptor Cys-rich [Mactra antiquata]